MDETNEIWLTLVKSCGLKQVHILTQSFLNCFGNPSLILPFLEEKGLTGSSLPLWMAEASKAKNI